MRSAEAGGGAGQACAGQASDGAATARPSWDFDKIAIFPGGGDKLSAVRVPLGTPLDAAEIVQRKCDCGGSDSENVPRLSQPSEPAERRADTVAERVMRQLGDEDDTPDDDGVQDADQGGNPSSATAMASLRSLPRQASRLETNLNAATGGGQAVEPGLRNRVEGKLGYDLASVRVYPAEGDGFARRFNARAFTVGQSIYFKNGEYRPDSADGMRLLLHELAHTTQPVPGDDTVLRFPSVSGWEFHNKDGGTTAADNCCPVCPRNTGVDSWPGGFKNGMELQAYLNNEPGASYDLKRVKERSTWERVGGKWNLASNIGPGADDDSTDTDECLTPQMKPPYLPYIFSEDQPGFSSTAGFDAAATDAVYKASFTESVSITGGGKTAADPKTFDWHTITWLVKGPGGWSIDKTRSEIASGSVTVGKTGP